eukprot:1896733-Rhodomonas_salina.3
MRRSREPEETECTDQGARIQWELTDRCVREQAHKRLTCESGENALGRDGTAWTLYWNEPSEA